MIPRSTLERIGQLSSNDCLAVQSLASDPYVTSLKEKLVRLGAEKSKGEAREDNRDSFYDNVYGQGLQHCTGRVSTQWLYNYKGSNRQYIDLIKLRNNLLPCRGAVASQSHDQNCRFGCGRRETVSHISQGCPTTHQTRMQRHDRVVDMIYKNIPKDGNTQILKEPHIRYDVGLKKPDLMVVKKDKIIICDVAIPWETPRPPHTHFEDKVRTYSEPTFVDEVRKRYPGREIIITALIITARGGSCPRNRGTFALLKLPLFLEGVLCIKTLENTLRVYKQFMRQVYTR